MREHNKGIVFGSIASACYGTNPLFTLPMYMAGIGVNSVLFYRYAIAVFIYAFWIKFVSKKSLRVEKGAIFPLFVMGIMFSFSSLFLYLGFKYIDAGIACTILFSYPIFVALIMAIFFKERVTKSVFLSLLLSFAGISLLHNGNLDAVTNFKGIFWVLLSSLCYAVYIVGVKQIRTLARIKSDILTFYVMLFGLSIYVVNLKFCTELQLINTPLLWVCAVSLAIFPTILSIELITAAIKLIGSTKSAILGSLEPLTALFFGVVVFHEELTLKMIFGIVAIILGVFLIILKRRLT